jgi:alpha-N-arabinofuranosidase
VATTIHDVARMAGVSIKTVSNVLNGYADRVTAASLAQLVNAIAPIMTEPGGGAWRQTTFFPFALTARLAVGSSLVVKLESETYQTKQHGEACLVDAVATHDPETGRSAVFVVNRNLESPTSFTVDLSRLGEVSILETHTLTAEDIYATNSYEDPDRVRLVPNDSARIDDGRLTVELPAVSWTAIALG